MAQDDYYYEIQLTNKQLVFYFMAGAAGLVLSFLAGVMVGRGVDNGGAAAATADAHGRRGAGRRRAVARPRPPEPTDYSYPQRLESERPAEGLDRPRPGGRCAHARPRRRCRTRADDDAGRHPGDDAPAGPHAAPGGPGGGDAAEGARLRRRQGLRRAGRRLQGQGRRRRHREEPAGPRAAGLHRAPRPPRCGGLFTVRVGVYRDRADAETVLDRLRDDKFQPYIIKQ